MTVDELINTLHALKKEHGNDVGLSVVAGDFWGVVQNVVAVQSTGPTLLELHCTDEAKIAFPPSPLPDSETTACGMPLGLVHPELYDENNQPRFR